MTETLLFILLGALVLDWLFGEPDLLWSRFPHPIVLFGKAVSVLDAKFNSADDPKNIQYRKGSIAAVVLIAASLAVGWLLQSAIAVIGLPGLFIELFLVFVLLAQRSLYDHVSAVAIGLREEGLAGGRKAVAMIVGRDPETLDTSGVSRAAIESLSENFSDGVVAPAFWYLIFGLPGIFAYKMINTADSMIGYRNEKYMWFGRTAAQIDDVANWLPARLSALLIALAALTEGGIRGVVTSLRCAFRDAGLHRSPNAGWPEAAMAGAIGVALGGPRDYSNERVPQSHINASGKMAIGIEDIENALRVFSFSCYALWAMIAVLLLLV